MTLSVLHKSVKSGLVTHDLVFSVCWPPIKDAEGQPLILLSSNITFYMIHMARIEV